MRMRYSVVLILVLLTIVALTNSTAGATTYVSDAPTPSVDPPFSSSHEYPGPISAPYSMRR
jgi:hypothetical protein